MRALSILPLSTLTATLLVAFAASADSAPWAIDASHSQVGFSVAHLVVSKVKGHFKDFSGKVTLNEADLTKSTVDVVIKVDSIDTGDAQRDKHLKSADFFDVANNAEITFHGTKIVRTKKGFDVTGDLKIHGVTKSVTLAGKLSDAVKSPWGKEVRGAEFTGSIKREDFNLKWNKTLEAGGVVVGKDVALDIALEINK